MQLFFVMQGYVVPGCSAGVPLVFRCSATIPECSAVPSVFRVPLFRVPVFLVL